MRAILLLKDIEYQGQNTPSDIVNVLCVDTNGTLQTATIARLLYRKWAEDVLAYSQSRKTYAAMVDIDFTGRGLSHCVPVAITAQESLVLKRIVDLAINHTNLIPKDGKIPQEMRWATSRILNTAIQEIEMQKEQILNREKAILATTTPDALRYSERTGVPVQGGIVLGTFQCPNCNSPTSLGQRFCGNCGRELV
jgi:hypothetical protein